jgi:DNA-binding response OmpR family regulator
VLFFHHNGASKTMFSQQTKTAPRLDDVSFLIVDDSIVMRNLIKLELMSWHCGLIREAADGGKGFDILETFAPDIILVDWEMQPMDGLAFVHKVRDRDRSPDPFVGIVMMSTRPQCRRALTARDAGVDAFLGKPFSRAGLLECVRTVIDNPRPFSWTDTYFGPDRRRIQRDYDGPERRASRKVRPAPTTDDQTLARHPPIRSPGR